MIVFLSIWVVFKLVPVYRVAACLQHTFVFVLASCDRSFIVSLGTVYVEKSMRCFARVVLLERLSGMNENLSTLSVSDASDISSKVLSVVNVSPLVPIARDGDKVWRYSGQAISAGIHTDKLARLFTVKSLCVHVRVDNKASIHR